jgi:DNA processing protein
VSDGFRAEYVDLYAVPRMNETRLKHLLAHFEDPGKVLSAKYSALRECPGIDEELARAVAAYRRSDETAQRIAAAEELGVRTLGFRDPGYPANLKDLAHMPPVLFARGSVIEEDRLAAAIVGTRRATHYGRQVAERFAQAFALSGVTVVSGLARGVDTHAHQAALEAGGRTIGVLGCGINVYYPPENRRLYDAVSANGAVLSEFPPGTEPLAMNFPKRNRVVSGLSRAIVAVEAGEKSGVLNTAAWAADQGRDVYAVPGPVTSPLSLGTNRLLLTGARPATCPEDVIRDLGVAVQLEEKAKVEVSAEEKTVLEALSADPLHVDEVCETLGMPMAVLLGVLMQLELKGLVRQLPGKFFVKSV